LNLRHTAADAVPGHDAFWSTTMYNDDRFIKGGERL
jgi:hypothetical protein